MHAECDGVDQVVDQVVDQEVDCWDFMSDDAYDLSAIGSSSCNVAQDVLGPESCVLGRSCVAD